MKYFCYGQHGSPSLLIGEKHNIPVIKDLLEEGDELLWTFEAESYFEAAIQMHERAGWEPYRPMDEDREEYLEALRHLGRNPKEINDERERHGLERLDWLDA